MPGASSYCRAAGWSSEPSPGLGDADGWPRTGNASTARRSHSSNYPPSASCYESYAIQHDLSGRTLKEIKEFSAPVLIATIINGA